MTQTLEREGLTFVCDDPLEVWRVETIRQKEPGTVAWIESFNRGDRFVDIGANVGIYTLLAAKQVGPTGSVVAIEPHLPNAVALMQNVQASGFADRVTVSASAVSERSGLRMFFYRSLERGSSGSQIDHAVLGGAVFRPVATECKYATPLDELLSVVRPSHVKVDVDGHELQIMRGLTNVDMVQSVQVETEPQHRKELTRLMAVKGFHVDCIHYTANGQAAIDRGADPASVIHNTIFRRTA